MFTSTDGRDKRAKVERELPGGVAQVNIKGVMLMRQGVQPDYKGEIMLGSGEHTQGYRTTLNAYRLRVSAGDMSLEAFTSSVWDRTCSMLIGETLDPAECINGVWLEDESKGGRGNVAFRLEVWFASRDDNACASICENLRQELIQATGGGTISAKFRKLQYFQEKKHFVSA